MPDQTTIEPAAAHELTQVRALLQQADLPAGGVEDQFPVAYVVARRESGVVGVGGLERYGTSGLLRSVVVSPEYSGRGLGTRVVTHLLTIATKQELAQVFLLTTTAPEYFTRFGFLPTARDEAPDAIRRAPEFATICPASAVCLVWHRPQQRNR